ncbi:MAG: hypothetical protein LBM77_01590 [Spirochaetaceae bacterium]|jgi:hypothetical protein|nr:hypothetical protein [Spirochaetaceae bacterium]
MKYIETMSLHDVLAIQSKAIDLENEGKHEEAEKMLHSAPLSPPLALLYRDYIGVDELLKSGWNLADAEANFGPNWLSEKAASRR